LQSAAVSYGKKMSLEAKIKIAEQLIRINQLAEAKISIRNLLEIAPDHATVLGLAGRLAYANFDYEGAILLLQRSLDLDPLNIPNRSTFFICLIKTNTVLKKYSDSNFSA
jgi:tetratricopeptide (TPR) repeat protein